jgi:hypothetical protein
MVSAGHFVPSKTSWKQFFSAYFDLDDYSNSTTILSPNPLLTGSGASSATSISGE